MNVNLHQFEKCFSKCACFSDIGQLKHVSYICQTCLPESIRELNMCQTCLGVSVKTFCAKHQHYMFPEETCNDLKHVTIILKHL